MAVPATVKIFHLLREARRILKRSRFRPLLLDVRDERRRLATWCPSLIPITATVTATVTVTAAVSVYVQGTVTVNQVAFAVLVSVARLLYVHSKPRLAATPRLRLLLPAVVILTPPLLLLLLLLRTLLPPLLPALVILLLHLGRLPSLVVNRPTWARTRATARTAPRLLPSRGRRRRRNGDLAPACTCGSGRL